MMNRFLHLGLVATCLLTTGFERSTASKSPGSVKGGALIPGGQPGDYVVQAIVIAETASGWRYAMSDLTRVVVASTTSGH